MKLVSACIREFYLPAAFLLVPVIRMQTKFRNNPSEHRYFENENTIWHTIYSHLINNAAVSGIQGNSCP